MKTIRLCCVIFLAALLGGCSTLALSSPKLAPNPPASTLSVVSVQGELTGEAHAQDEIGEMSVVFLILRNDTDTERSISLSRTVGFTPDERRVSLIPAGEAVHQVLEANRPSIWAGALTGAAAGTLGGAAVGGITGAIAGAALGPPGAGAGAAIFAAAGAATGAIVGAAAGALQAARGANSEVHPQAGILNRRLTDQIIAQASQVEGYIFLPKDNYSHIDVIVSSDTEGEQQLTIPIAVAN